MEEIQKEKIRLQIKELKEHKKALILAHYYQDEEIQELADYVGDSLGLAQKAAQTDAEIIVFCGVHFMAETAKMLNPKSKVVLPDLNAGCSLADSCPPNLFQQFKDQHPNHTVVTYVNCSAEIKAMSDIVCTSSNAVKVINSIPKDQPILFAPDKNLGKYLIKETNRDLLLWDGACVVHEAFSMEKLLQLHADFPDAEIIAHPESEMHLLKVAQYVGSTAGMLNHVQQSEHTKFIVATEVGILHEMQKKCPNKQFIPAPSKENNTCACSECAYMRVNTLEKLLLCLKNETPTIELTDRLIKEAVKPIHKMLALS